LSGNNINQLTKDRELDEREKEDLAHYLKKYLDIWCEGIYIITQYSTIFLECSFSSNLNSQQPPQKQVMSRHPLLSIVRRFSPMDQKNP
jgi:hypothetical protein